MSIEYRDVKASTERFIEKWLFWEVLGRFLRNLILKFFLNEELLFEATSLIIQMSHSNSHLITSLKIKWILNMEFFNEILVNSCNDKVLFSLNFQEASFQDLTKHLMALHLVRSLFWVEDCFKHMDQH